MKDSLSAENILRAGVVYCDQLRAMMAPAFCAVSVLSQLKSVKSKFKLAIEENVENLNLGLKPQVLAITNEMLEIHADELEVRLPLVVRKLNELRDCLKLHD